MEELDRLLASCLFEINNCGSIKKLEEVKSAILGKNGKITALMKNLKNLSQEDKKVLGAVINSIKNNVVEKINQRYQEIEMLEMEKKLANEYVDVSMPIRAGDFGKIHPLTHVMTEIGNIFRCYGFTFADGPDIETEFCNFTVMNMPEHHTARTMHDTFYVNTLADDKGRRLLRTHTSTVQYYAMTTKKPPFRSFSIGTVYRSDYDATHTPMFHQLEGIVIDKDVGFAHLKWLIMDFLKKFFKTDNIEIRLRPSYFPFTEPSAEVDVKYEIKNGKIVLGKGNRWLEICGCGVMHPNVLKHGSIDTNKYQGIAFGFGIERLASLKYGIPDLRGYFESTETWRNSFGFSHVKCGE